MSIRGFINSVECLLRENPDRNIILDIMEDLEDSILNMEEILLKKEVHFRNIVIKILKVIDNICLLIEEQSCKNNQVKLAMEKLIYLLMKIEQSRVQGMA